MKDRRRTEKHDVSDVRAVLSRVDYGRGLQLMINFRADVGQGGRPGPGHRFMSVRVDYKITGDTFYIREIQELHWRALPEAEHVLRHKTTMPVASIRNLDGIYTGTLRELGYDLVSRDVTDMAGDELHHEGGGLMPARFFWEKPVTPGDALHLK